MDAVMDFLQATFGPLVLIFTVSNLAAMGLQVKVPDVAVAMRNRKSMALIFVWGWLLGPALGLLITKVLPLAEPFAIVILLASLAPFAPFLQQMVTKARGDMGFTGAFIPLVVVGTVILMPVMAPMLIKGLTIVWCLVLYGPSMLDTAGSLALLSMTLFMVGMGLITYLFGFGMQPAQKSVMALGMGTRNIAAVLAAALAIPDGDTRIVVMVVMWTLWSVVLAAVGARIFAKKADRALARGSQ